MIEFIRGGLMHWMLDGETPCGALPRDEYAERADFLRGVGPNPAQEVEFPWESKMCPICIPTRVKYQKFIKNGGVDPDRLWACLADHVRDDQQEATEAAWIVRDVRSKRKGRRPS